MALSIITEEPDVLELNLQQALKKEVDEHLRILWLRATDHRCAAWLYRCSSRNS
jgi:hypothetical protein